MRRFRLPVLLILSLALLLSACAKKQGPEWGNLSLTLERVQQTDQHWTARMVLSNPTDKVQVIEYTASPRYTLIVTQGDKEVLVQPFDIRKEEDPKILNLAPGVSKEYPVAWTFRDQDGNRVSPGTYYVSVRLEAVTVVQDSKGQPILVEPRSVGPVQVKVQ